MKYYNDVTKEVLRASESIQYKRQEKPFTPLEISLGYSSYAVWHSWFSNERKNSSTTNSIETRESIRQITIKLLEHIKKHPSLTRSVKRKCPTYLPNIECKWAKEEPERPEWKQCFSRGIILISTNLALNLIDSKILINFPYITEKDELEIAKLWLSNTLSKEAAREILLIK